MPDMNNNANAAAQNTLNGNAPQWITKTAADMRAGGTGYTWEIKLAIGSAMIRLCPQPYEYECSLHLVGVPPAVARDIDTGLWKSIESALGALRWGL